VFFIADKGFHWNLWWAKQAANVVGVTVNFLLERWWVFGGKRPNKHLTEVSGRYILLTLCNFVIDYWIVYGLKVVGVTPYLGQFASAGFFWGWNYLWYKYWVFRDGRKGRKQVKRRRKA
jgi:putative flippase GtrA